MAFKHMNLVQGSMKAPLGGDLELPPEGRHTAVIVGLVDLGTHQQAYQGELRNRHLLSIVWEIDALDSEQNRFLVAQSYTFSQNKQAKLVEDMALGLDVNPDFVQDMDLAQLIGQTMSFRLTHETSKQGSTFLKVQGLAPTDSTMEPFVFPVLFDDPATGDVSQLKAFPKWLLDKVETCQERNPVRGQTHQPGRPAQQGDDEELPF